MADAPAYQALDGAARAAYARKTYALLGLAPECGAAKLKKAYKKASLQYHPDKQHGKTDEEKALAASGPSGASGSICFFSFFSDVSDVAFLSSFSGVLVGGSPPIGLWSRC